MKWTAHLPHGTVTALVILAGAALIYESGAWNKAVSIAENVANQNSEAVLRTSSSFKHQIALKDAKMAKDSAHAAYLTWSLSQLKVQNESLKVNLAKATTPQDTIKAQTAIIFNLKSQNDTLTKKCDALDTIASTCKEEKAAMQVRIDTLESALTKQVASTKCHILLILGCPTRTASAEIGVGVGATLALLLSALFGH